jgi:iron complex outermembrane receptor protein
MNTLNLSKVRHPIKLRRVATSASILAIAAAVPAFAQDTDVSPVNASSGSVATAETEAQSDIVVTGSRVARPGFTAPTPVTAISAAEMNVRAPSTIADTLATIPSFRATNTPSTSGVTSRGGGIVTADLRALAPTRTLVLLDGRRFVPSGDNGVVDLKLIPQLMIESIDVVTGGASAAYGSDAIAGVVNFKLNTKIRGLVGSMQGGISERGDGKSLRGSLAAGGELAGGLISFVVGGDYSKLYGIGNQYTRDWGRKEVGLVINPLFATNGLPNYIIAENARPATLSPNGLITSGPLRGTEFLPNGGTRAFNFGTLYGASNALMIGGDNQGNHLSNATLLGSPVESYTGLAHVDFNASTMFNPYVELSYGNTRTTSQTQQPRLTGATAIPVSINNVFLPASVRAGMVANGLTSISVSRLLNDTGPIQLDITNKTFRAMGGVRGELGGGWSYDAYYQYGQNKYAVDSGPNNLIYGRFLQEVAGCPGTTAAAGCRPVNIFGDGSLSPDSYAFGTASFRETTKQNVASFNLNGTPFSTWAGPVSIASGIEYRKEEANGTSDPVSQALIPVGTSGQSIAGGYMFGNQLPIKGSYDLWEIYGETVIPLLRDSAIAKSLDFNGAIRRTDYSTSGAVVTWKMGLTWQVNNELRFRATRSRDIRAPNINDLFQFGGSQFAVVFDPVVGGTTQTRFVTTGNVNLKPEKARTWTGGVVYEPQWLPGAGFSLDYYNIAVDGVIGTLSPSIIAADCTAGVASACASIVRNANGSYAFFRTQVINLSALKTSGLDFEARYQTRLNLFGDSSSKLAVRLLGTYVDKLETISPTGLLRRVGTLSNFNGNSDTVSGVPHLTGVFDATLSADKWLLNLQTRFVGSGKFNNAFTQGAGAVRTINDNSIPAYAYLSLSAQYNLQVGGKELQIFGTVNNLLDTDPPRLPSGTVGFANETSTNPAYYDVVGRAFTLGIRFKL